VEVSQEDRAAYSLRAGDAEAHRQRLARLCPWYATFLRRWLPADKSSRILDLPCGDGNLLFALKDLGFTNLLGVDVDPGQVALAQQLGLTARVGDVFEHVPIEQALEFCKLARRALSPGGMLICRTPCADGPFGSHDRHNDLTHRWGMTSGAAGQFLILAGFQPDEISVVGEPPVPYKLVNWFRLQLYRVTTAVVGAWLELCGIGAPRVWTRSMWIVAGRGGGLLELPD